MIDPHKRITTQSTNPIVVAVDVTGSMANWPFEIFDRLPLLYNTLSQYREDARDLLRRHRRRRAWTAGRSRSPSSPTATTWSSSSTLSTARVAAATRRRATACSPGGWRTTSPRPDAVNRPFLIVFGDAPMHETIPRSPDREAPGRPAGERGPARPDLRQRRQRQGSRRHRGWRRVATRWNVWFLRRPTGRKGDEVDRQWATALGADHVFRIDDEQRAVDYAMGLVARELGPLRGLPGQHAGAPGREQGQDGGRDDPHARGRGCSHARAAARASRPRPRAATSAPTATRRWSCKVPPMRRPGDRHCPALRPFPGRGGGPPARLRPAPQHRDAAGRVRRPSCSRRLAGLGQPLWVDLKGRQLRVVAAALPPFTEVRLSHRIRVPDAGGRLLRRRPRARPGAGRGRRPADPGGRPAARRRSRASRSTSSIPTSRSRARSPRRTGGISRRCERPVFQRGDALFRRAARGRGGGPRAAARSRAAAEDRVATGPRLRARARRPPWARWWRPAATSTSRRDVPTRSWEPCSDVIAADPEAIVASRLFPSLARHPVPECAEIGDAAFLLSLGYRTFLLGDEVCLRRDSVMAALEPAAARWRGEMA